MGILLKTMKKLIPILLILLILISCSSIESGFYIESVNLENSILKPGEETNLEVRIAKKSGRQQIQHTANMKVEVISENPNIKVIPLPLSEAEEVSNNSISVVARAGGVLPRPFKFKIQISSNCKPGQYIITIKSKVNNEEDLKIINLTIEGG